MPLNMLLPYDKEKVFQKKVKSWVQEDPTIIRISQNYYYWKQKIIAYARKQAINRMLNK